MGSPSSRSRNRHEGPGSRFWDRSLPSSVSFLSLPRGGQSSSAWPRRLPGGRHGASLGPCLGSCQTLTPLSSAPVRKRCQEGATCSWCLGDAEVRSWGCTNLLRAFHPRSFHDLKKPREGGKRSGRGLSRLGPCSQASGTPGTGFPVLVGSSSTRCILASARRLHGVVSFSAQNNPPGRHPRWCGQSQELALLRGGPGRAPPAPPHSRALLKYTSQTPRLFHLQGTIQCC